MFSKVEIPTPTLAQFHYVYSTLSETRPYKYFPRLINELTKAVAYSSASMHDFIPQFCTFVGYQSRFQIFRVVPAERLVKCSNNTMITSQCGEM